MSNWQGCRLPYLNAARRARVLPAVLSLAAAPLAAGEPGVRFSLDYTADAWTTMGGSVTSGTAYLDNLGAALEANLEPLLGWPDTRAVFSALYNNGHEFGGRYVGDLQGLSNIETGVSALRVFEAFVETGIGARSSLLIGFFDLNSEFDALETSALFIHSAHGIGTDVGQTGIAGPSIFPVTSLAVRFEHGFGKRWRARAAALDAVPGDRDRPLHPAVELDREEGALLIVEVERRFGAGKLLGGAWRYTAAFPDELASARAGAQFESRGNHGAYLRGEWKPGDWAFFVRLGRAAPRFNAVEWYAGAGAVYEGALTGRPEDLLGLAFALAAASGPHRCALSLDGQRAASGELAIELTYAMRFGERFTFQPDLQYIVAPGLDPAAGNT